MGVFGDHLFGQIQRVPGLFFVSTMFFHINYVPLFPQRSYLVLEGSEKDEHFQGVQIPLNLKSVFAGYLRGWSGATAIFIGCAGVSAPVGVYIGMENGGIIVAALAAVVGIFWFIFKTHTWWFLPIQLILLVASVAVYQDVRTRVPDAVRIPGAAPGTRDRLRDDASCIDALLIANAAALVFSLTRFLTPASYRRAVELGQRIGPTPEQVAVGFGLDPSNMPEWPPVEEAS
jgi:hypothetical protein